MGKTPTTSVRRLISLFTRSSGFVDQICRQCRCGNPAKASRSGRASSSIAATFGWDLASCEHPRLSGRKGQYSTLHEHVPPQHRNIDALWSRPWFTNRGRSVGPVTVTVIERILHGQVIEAQGYLS